MNQEKITDQEHMNGIDIQGILKHLPHRYPFLMVDKVIEYTPGKSLLALKNVTCNEPFFAGHFPKKMVMPGVLILEALAQAMGLLASLSNTSYQEKESLYYLVGIDNARFKRLVEPGDQVILEINVTRALRNIWRSKAEAKVDGNLVASAEIMCAAKEA